MSAAADGPRSHRTYPVIVDEVYAEMGRQRLGQVALADRLGVTQPWLNRRLKGHTDISVPELEAICEALGLTLPELVARAAASRSTRISGGPSPTPHNGGHIRHGLLGSWDRHLHLAPTG